jgi:hypothetical protein
MRRSYVLISGTCLLLLIPTNVSARFDGLPFDTPWELSAVLGLVLLLVFKPSRTSLLNGLDERNTGFIRLLPLGLLCLILMKLSMFAIVPTTGEFEVCYRNFNARSGLPCLPTFEPHPRLSSFSEQFEKRSTDVPRIDFGHRNGSEQGLTGSSWRLPFVNSLDFDRGFWPWNSAEKDIKTFPFWAEFRGDVTLGEGERVQITYVGQGRLILDGVEVVLPPSYQQPARILSPEFVGSVMLVVDFGYLNTKRYSTESSPLYAELRVERAAGRSTTLLQTESKVWVSAANALSDLFTLSILGWFIWLARKHTRVFLVGLLLSFACLACFVSRIEIGFGAFRFESELIVLTLAVLMLRDRFCRLVYLAPSIVVVSAGLTLREIETIRGSTPLLGDVLVRLRGNDHLVYQGLVREMLSSGFLRGGEDIFYFQPGIRYVFYSIQMFLGESLVLLGIASMSLIGLGIFYFLDGIPILRSPVLKLTRLTASVSLVIWWSSSHTIQSSIDGLSEFGTWILLFFLFGLLLRISFRWAPLLIAAGGAMVIWIRPNQGIAILSLLILSIWLRRQYEKSQALNVVRSLFIFLTLLLLIPLHNVAFGGTLAALPGGHLNATQKNWDTFLRVIEDSEAREFVWSQVQGLLYLPWVLPSIYSPRLALAILGFGFTGLLALTTAIKQKTIEWQTFLMLLAVIIGQVVPFAKYSLYRYFPIHNVAIYLTAVLVFVVMVCLSESSLREKPSRVIKNDQGEYLSEAIRV